MITPPGIILIWSGAIVDIPDEFVLCDGNNGTPNLSGRFVLGASVGFPPGSTGGSWHHEHTFTTDGHQHDIQLGTGISFGTSRDDETSVDTDSGTTDDENHAPPYYALAYIMRRL